MGERVDLGAIKAAADTAQKVVALHEATSDALRLDTGWFTREHFVLDAWPASIAEHLATCSPAAILALVAVVEALQGIMEIGKRDMSNPKYAGYFYSAETALAAFTPTPPSPEETRDE